MGLETQREDLTRAKPTTSATLRARRPAWSRRVARRLRFDSGSRGRARTHDRISDTRYCASSRRAENLMNLIINGLRRLRGNDEGQDLLEYALLIALVAVAAVAFAGSQVNAIFQNIGSQLAAVV